MEKEVVFPTLLYFSTFLLLCILILFLVILEVESRGNLPPRYTPSPFHPTFFSLRWGVTILLRLVSNYDPLTSDSQVAGHTGVYHQLQLVFLILLSIFLHESLICRYFHLKFRKNAYSIDFSNAQIS